MCARITTSVGIPAERMRGRTPQLGHPCRAPVKPQGAHVAAHARRCHVCGRPCRVHAPPYMHVLRLEPMGGCVVAGAFEDCCLAYHRRARLSLLRHAQSYHRQDVSGSCNLPAVM